MSVRLGNGPRDLAYLVGAVAVTYLTVVGYAGTSSLTVPYGTYLLPALLGVDALLLIGWWPPSVLYVGAAAQILPFLRSTSFAIVGTIMLLVVAASRAWGTADRMSRRGAITIAVLAVTTLVFGLAFTGIHDTGGEPMAVVFAAALGICAALLRPAVGTLLIAIIGVGTLASYAALTSNQLRVDRNAVLIGENANGIGMLAALGLVACALALRQRHLSIRALAVLGGWLCAAGVLASGSRGALLAVFAGVATLLAHRLLVGPPIRAAMILAALSAVILFVSGPAFDMLLQLSGRQGNGTTQNIVARQAALSYAVHAGLAHPFSGVGLNRLATVSHADPNSGLGLSAHDVFAGLFAECGVFAFTALVVLCALALVRSGRQSPAVELPLVVTVIVSGLSLEWWGTGLTGAMALLILGSAVASPPSPVPDAAPRPADTRGLRDRAIVQPRW